MTNTPAIAYEDYAPAYDDGNLHYYITSDGIQCFHIRDMRRDAIDRWFDIAAHNDEVAARTGALTLSLYQIENAWPTPYMAAKVKQSADNEPENVEQRIAVYIADSFLNNIFMMFLQSIPSRMLQNIRFFKQHDEAVAWLFAEAAACAEQI